MATPSRSTGQPTSRAGRVATGGKPVAPTLATNVPAAAGGQGSGRVPPGSPQPRPASRPAQQPAEEQHQADEEQQDGPEEDGGGQGGGGQGGRPASWVGSDSCEQVCNLLCAAAWAVMGFTGATAGEVADGLRTVADELGGQ